VETSKPQSSTTSKPQTTRAVVTQQPTNTKLAALLSNDPLLHEDVSQLLPSEGGALSPGSPTEAEEDIIGDMEFLAPEITELQDMM